MTKSRNRLLFAILNFIALWGVTFFFIKGEIPMHISFTGQVEFGSKWIIIGFGLLPIIFCLGEMLYRKLTKNNQAVRQNRRVEDIVFGMITTLFVFITWLPILLNYYFDKKDTMLAVTKSISIIMVIMGLFIMLISNYMGTIKMNHFLGIRVPWTLKDEYVWKKTHRLAGYTGVVGGLIVLLGGITTFISDNEVYCIIGFVIGLILLVVIPIIYSYKLYKKRHG